MIQTLDVGVLGATGTVGSRIVRLLDGHPWFRVREVAASPGSAGRTLDEVIHPEEEGRISPDLGRLVLKSPDEDWNAPLLLSALPSAAAAELEADLARRGHLVVSNASSHRMDADVPLVVPEVNPGHLSLLESQASRWAGGIVTNPNCSVAGLVLALAPLHRTFGLRRVVVTTLQAISGAGRPGPPAGDLTDNVIPFIAGEEEKIAAEPRKILGDAGEGGVEPAAFTVSATATRVPVLHGHLASVSATLEQPASPEEVAHALASFRGAMEEELPGAPVPPIRVLSGEARPQPRLDRDRDGGMSVSVGRIRPCEAGHVKFLVLSHNLVRGAAGAALLNAELCHARGVTARAAAR